MEKLTWISKKVKVSDLKNWEGNPRTLDQKGFDDIKSSIEEDGDWGVIVCDIDLTVVSGNQRLRAFVDKKVEEVDVKVPSRKLTEKERRRIALRANRTKGKDDWDMLANWDKEDLMEGWLNEEDIMLGFGLNNAEDVEVDESRLDVLTIQPPESPKLKDRVYIETKSVEDLKRIKRYVEENGVERILGLILDEIG